MNATHALLNLIELNEEDLDLAFDLAFQQTNHEKSEKIYYNTLAVLAVNKFLHKKGVDTDLEAGESWNTVGKIFKDVADLVIPDIGRIECRLIGPDEEFIDLPIEVREDRIGCVVAKFDEVDIQVEILGCYLPKVPGDDLPERISVDSDTLVSFDELLERLARANNIRDWLESLLDLETEFIYGWEKDEGLSLAMGGNPEARSRGYRKGGLSDLNTIETVKDLVDTLNSKAGKIRRSCLKKLGEKFDDDSAISALVNFLEVEQSSKDKTLYWLAAISLGRIAPNHSKAAISFTKLIHMRGVDPIRLVVSRRKHESNSIAILVQIYPTDNQEFVPEKLSLAVLDETGKIWREVIAQEKADFVQMSFAGLFYEKFSLRIKLGELTHIESFVLKDLNFK